MYFIFSTSHFSSNTFVFLFISNQIEFVFYSFWSLIQNIFSSVCKNHFLILFLFLMFFFSFLKTLWSSRSQKGPMSSMCTHPFFVCVCFLNTCQLTALCCTCRTLRWMEVIKSAASATARVSLLVPAKGDGERGLPVEMNGSWRGGVHVCMPPYINHLNVDFCEKALFKFDRTILSKRVQQVSCWRSLRCEKEDDDDNNEEEGSWKCTWKTFECVGAAIRAGVESVFVINQGWSLLRWTFLKQFMPYCVVS